MALGVGLTYLVGEQLPSVPLDFNDCLDEEGVVANHVIVVACLERFLHVETRIVHLTCTNRAT